MMKKSLQPIHRVGSMLNEQFEQVLSQCPVIKAHVAIPQLSELPFELNIKLIKTYVAAVSGI
jgi:hypothetical protein